MKKLLFAMLAVATIGVTGCKKDPCKDMECQNGGVCVDGTCECPTGWGGTNCETAQTPTKVIITGIDINDFPGTDGGSDWDPWVNTDPDILLEIEDNDGQVILWTSAEFTDMADGTSFSINGLSIDVTSPQSAHTLKMWDYDQFDADDSMGDIVFTPWLGGGFPATRSIVDAAQEIDYTLHLSYEW